MTISLAILALTMQIVFMFLLRAKRSGSLRPIFGLLGFLVPAPLTTWVLMGSDGYIRFKWAEGFIKIDTLMLIAVIAGLAVGAAISLVVLVPLDRNRHSGE